MTDAEVLSKTSFPVMPGCQTGNFRYKIKTWIKLFLNNSLDRLAIKSHSHGVKTIVYVKSNPGDGTSKRRVEEKSGITYVITVQVLSKWSIGL
mmetsp:Transcript_24045/g.36678  ORF Transcript_24045/g.36678 Transcript_24045/m.36678 type:complete len:93 (-) Transcript_24045:1067-1345(-)